jgi:NAD-dependent SIR2 family protein deacetylase
MVQVNSEKNKKNLVFFIGAGFTKAIVSTAPTGAEFFSKAFDPNGPFSSDNRINNVKEFIESIYYKLKKNNYPRIEDVLSLIDYAIQRKEALSKDYLFDEVINVRNNLIYLISKVIKDSIEKSPQKNLNMSSNFVEKLGKLLGESKRVFIISTNYDIIIDNALLERKSCNYGFNLRYNIYWYPDSNNRNARPIGSLNWEFRDSYEGKINEGDIPLLKIHGSLNWFYCPKCNELDITIGRKGATSLAEDQNRFLCVDPYCTSTYEPLLVTPTMLKIYDNSFLQKLWDLSEKIISESDIIVFIGYSLPEADYHIRCLLTKAMTKDKSRDHRIVVIEKNPTGAKEKELISGVGNRYKLLFGEEKVVFRPIDLEGLLNEWDNIINEVQAKLSTNKA